MNFRINYSIIYVRDMERSLAFYRDVVGIPTKFVTPEWAEFATEGATLALHVVEAEAAGDEGDTAARPGTCRAGFHVEDLGAFHARMVESGVACLQQPTATHGVHIAQYVDPDGMVFSVSGKA